MNRHSTTARIAALTLSALALAGCGATPSPAPPAPVTEAVRPQPGGVGGGDQGGAPTTDTGCNPRASLPPSADAASGSTMDKIKKRGKLIVGVDQNTNLFGYRNTATGNLEGFDIDIAKQVAKSLFGSAEDTIQFRAIPSSQRESVLEKNEVDIVVRTYTTNCERQKKIDFSTVYFVAGQRVLVPNVSEVKGLDDLGGKRVCAADGSTSVKLLSRHPAKPVPVSVPNWSDCLLMLQQGQVDAVSTDDVILAGMKEQDPATKIVGERLTEEPYAIGVPKGQEDMVRYVNSVLDTVRGGPWQESYTKWLTGKLDPASPPQPEYK